MFDLTSSKLLLLAVVALLVIGPKDFPVLLRAIGKYMGIIRGHAKEFRAQFDEAMRDSEIGQIKKDMESFGRETEATLTATKQSVEQTFAEARQGVEASVEAPVEAPPKAAGRSSPEAPRRRSAGSEAVPRRRPTPSHGRSPRRARPSPPRSATETADPRPSERSRERERKTAPKIQRTRRRANGRVRHARLPPHLPTRPRPKASMRSRRPRRRSSTT